MKYFNHEFIIAEQKVYLHFDHSKLTTRTFTGAVTRTWCQSVWIRSYRVHSPERKKVFLTREIPCFFLVFYFQPTVWSKYISIGAPDLRIGLQYVY